MRESRKMDHIKHTLTLPDGPGNTALNNIHLIHNCLPNIKLDDIDLKTSIAGITLENPIIINAITGGAKDVKNYNSELAEIAKRTGSAMAVGSQFAMIRNQELRDTFEIVRNINPNGIIFANIGAHARPEEVNEVISAINANAVQIHLNVAQELIMPEGDRDFTNYLDNIIAIVNSVPVPVIIKEVGFGMGLEQVETLQATGIKAIDIGGKGGTNFISIEAKRSTINPCEEFFDWGIPTALSTIEAKEIIRPDISLIVSGGIRTECDIAKALVIGGNAVGIAGPILKSLINNGKENTVLWFNNLLLHLKKQMLLIGAKNIIEMQQKPFVVTGFAREWLLTRGIDITKYARPKSIK